MGNFRFRLSDMIPNAWFYKLREIGNRNHPNPNHKTKQQHQQQLTSAKTKQVHHSYPRKSYHFTRDLIPTETLYTIPDPPRKSSKQRTFRKRVPSPQSQRPVNVMSSSVSAGCGCRAKPHSPPEYSASSSSFSSSDCSAETELRSDSVLATKDSDAKFDGLGMFPELELPRIITKQSKLSETEEDAMKTEHVKKATSPMKEEKRSNGFAVPVPVRKSNVNCPSGVRLRVNSPRLAGSRKIQGHARRSALSRNRRSLSDSFAVVKSSADPQRDFRESMVEMIVENNIRGAKDLEDLLACYLSLNSDQYHDLIIKVFKQIWFDLSDVR